MRLRELIDLLECEVVWVPARWETLEVHACFAADLMSDVLAYSQPGALLITGLISIQSAHTADVADLAAILYVAGKRPPHAVLDLACERRIPLLSTRISMFDACGVLYKAGLKAASRSCSPPGV